jgi:hypothetical protein
MKISVEKGIFSISDIEFEMMQNITNGLVVQQEKYDKHINELNDCLKKDIPVKQIEDYNELLNYICEKHKELENIIFDCQSILMKWFDKDE